MITKSPTKKSRAKADSQTMAELVEKTGLPLVPFREGEATEVTVLEVLPKRIVVDVAGVNIGTVPEREFSFDSKELQPGDKVLAYVLASENEMGQVVLSLRRADRERLWTNLVEKYESQTALQVKVNDANRGGLIVEVSGVEGFLPVSQLSPKHYPQVGGDKSGILDRLNQLIGQTLEAKILNVDKAANRLIVSERAVKTLTEEAAMDTLKVGDIATGTVTGVVPFGVFISLGETEGLIHISEVAWDRVDNLPERFSIGDKVKVKVIQIEGNRVSLSVKRLLPDPWAEESKKLKVDSVIAGTVTKLAPFGAFVKILPKIDGLAHISQLGEKITDPTQVVSEDKKYHFKILSIDPASHKVSLQLVVDTPKSKPVSRVKKAEPGSENPISSPNLRSARLRSSRRG